MEGGFKNKEACPQLIDLIHKDREWLMRSDEKSLGVSEEKKLELRLGPPGEEDESSLSSHFYHNNNTNTWLNDGSQNHHKFVSSEKQQLGGSVFSTTWCTNPSVYQMKTQQQQSNNSSYHQFPSLPHTLPVKGMESSNTCSTKGVGELQQQSQTEKKACSQPSATVPANTAVNNNSSQKRSAPAPVIGWPPVRSFRKNLASSTSSKQVQDSQNGDPPKEIKTKQESCGKGMFVKINMDGVPIGRKVDLKAYNSYEKLSSAVDELFRDLLAAQRDSPVTGNHNKVEDVKEITGLLDGSGEYTLVYEDNEGDRMLVGDVPWEMFATAVKRLRVLKSSELSTLRVGSGKQGRQPQ